MGKKITHQGIDRDQAARAMLLLHSKDAIAALEASRATSAAIAALVDNDPYATHDDLDAAGEQALRDLGYAVDLASIRRQADTLRDGHAGMWAGNYLLIDSTKATHSLLVTSADVRILLNGVDEVARVPSDGDGFQARALTIDNDAVHLELSFSSSLDDVDLDDSDLDLSALAEAYEVRVEGTLTIKDDSATTREVSGKRGVETPAGVLARGGGDPAWIWEGDYEVRYTDTQRWEWRDDLVTISCNPETHELGVRIGGVEAVDVAYQRGVIGCVLGDGSTSTRVTMAMHATPQGTRGFRAWLETTGQMRTINGYATQGLDHEALWRGPSSKKRAMALAAAPVPAPTRLGAGTVDFCSTVYDVIFDANQLVKPATDSDAVTLSSLLGSDGRLEVDERDEAGNKTGRVAVFTFGAGEVGPLRFSKGATLQAYQELDGKAAPRSGLEHTVVGVQVEEDFNLPALVETDFYEVRLSLENYAAIDSTGLKIELAIDDAAQPHLIRIHQPGVGTCGVDPTGGSGPDAAVRTRITDFSKASALVRGTTGETQVVGTHYYSFAVRPRGEVEGLRLMRTIHVRNDEGQLEAQGEPTAVDVPILMSVPIDMDSRDAIEISGDQWAPAARGKVFRGRIVASKGTQPFTWRLLADDKPVGLTWSPNLPVDTDLSQTGLVALELSGTVGDHVDPGTSYQPLLRVMSDRKVVMAPAFASPQIVITEPETEGQTTFDVFNVIAAVAADVAAIAALVMTGVLYGRDVRREKEKERRERNDRSIELGGYSLDRLGKFGTEVKNLADNMGRIRENAEAVRKAEKRLRSYERELHTARNELDHLRDQYREATHEATRRSMEKKIRGKEDHIKRKEKDHSSEKRHEEKRHEHKKSRHEHT